MSTFQELRESCARKGTLFEDPDFTPTPYKGWTLEWKRPQEIVKDPRLVVDEASRLDLKQGFFPDGWFVSAFASYLATAENINERLYQIMPQDNSLSENYQGILHFRFYEYTEWVDVIIDDRLPTRNNKLLGLHSSKYNEFWPALLEKAYAKFKGGYEALSQGNSSAEAMLEITDGFCERRDLTKCSQDLFSKIQLHLERHNFMTCIAKLKNKFEQHKSDNGIVTNIDYSLTGAKKFEINGRDIELIRLQMPWGNEREWTGAWSDRSAEWNLIDDETKKQLELNFDDNGEFWMSFEDFVGNFSNLEICLMGLSNTTEKQIKTGWTRITTEASFRRGETAGGCRNNIDTFHKNPQQQFALEEDGEHGELEVIINLRQKRKKNTPLATIGYAIYKISDEYKAEYERMGKLDKQFFLFHASHARSHLFMAGVYISGHHKLLPGEYVVIPSTFKPDVDAECLLDIFIEEKC